MHFRRGFTLQIPNLFFENRWVIRAHNRRRVDRPAPSHKAITRMALCIQVKLLSFKLWPFAPNVEDGTDIKPDNVLVNYNGTSARFSEVQLGDCGDAYRFKPRADPLEEGHVIDATIFRSSEAMLNLRWGPPTDMWSLRTTVSS